MKVTIFGASGFVGASLVERLLAEGLEFQAYVHSTGNAARLARWSVPLMAVDVLCRTDVDRAIAGCTHVVNCSRGPSDVMIDGLKNLLWACRKHRVTRFVHLSSVAVYGNASGQGLHEDHPLGPVRTHYGEKKLKQDKLVLAAMRQGLDSVILCPPMISGPYSSFLLEILSAAERGQLALVDNGQYPCSLVDVTNLAHAIRLALTTKTGYPERIFITDGAPPNWDQLIHELLPLSERNPSIGRVTCEEAAKLIEPPARKRISFTRSLRTLASSEVRAALRKDPLFASLESVAKAGIARLPRALRERLKRSTSDNHIVRQNGFQIGYSTNLLWHQLRRVTYSVDLARNVLGYEPVVSFEQSMEAFRRWYRTLHGLDDPWRPLLRDA